MEPSLIANTSIQPLHLVNMPCSVCLKCCFLEYTQRSLTHWPLTAEGGHLLPPNSNSHRRTLRHHTVLIVTIALQAHCKGCGNCESKNDNDYTLSDDSPCSPGSHQKSSVLLSLSPAPSFSVEAGCFQCNRLSPALKCQRNNPRLSLPVILIALCLLPVLIAVHVLRMDTSMVHNRKSALDAPLGYHSCR